MNTATNGASQSIWMATASVPEFPPIPGDCEADVCVIGGGIAGMTTAYLLAREGRQVLLIDAMGIGAGETGRTTAHFFPPDEWYADIADAFGDDKLRHLHVQRPSTRRHIYRHRRNAALHLRSAEPRDLACRQFE